MRKYTAKGKSSRCRVHIGDFRQQRKALPFSDDPFSEDVFEKRKQQIRKEREMKGTDRTAKRQGLERLLKDIKTQ